MSIFKDTFRGYVRDQLEIREELISIGNPNKFNDIPNDETNTNRRNKTHTFEGRNGSVTLKPGSHHTYTLNKQCVIRMTSLVDYVDDVNIEIGGLEGDQSFDRLKGASLSQNFILQGGILSDYARTFQKTDENGNPITARRVRRADQVRASFQKPGLKTNIAYGDFAIGANASEDGYGIVPMPGIIDATVRTKSAYGSLREGKINFEVHNQRQLEIMEMLYMRPGYMVLLEWGWCPYINNEGTIVNNLRLVESETNNDIYTNKITQNALYNSINTLKESSNGNYDGMLGFVKNFGFKAREDGGYSCFTELSSIGEVIESIKVPPVSIINTTKDITPSGNDHIDDGGEITVSGGIVTTTTPLSEEKKRGIVDDALSSGALDTAMTATEIALLATPAAPYILLDQALTYLGVIDGISATAHDLAQTHDARGTGVGDVNRDTFDKAIATKIFPSFNGLLGLINVINNYTIFGHELNESENSDEVINEVFSIDDEFIKGNIDEDLNETESAKTQAKLDAINTTLKKQGGLRREAWPAERKEFLRNLIVFQSSDFETFCLNLFNLKNKTDLKDYIIPTTSKTRGGKEEGIDQAYIRWDALATLINAYLIPKTEKGLPPVNVVTDRVYDIDKDISKLDPLLFCPIVSYISDVEDNTLLDFSCDANVCILPLQFDSGESSGVIDSLGIEDVLGYIPNIKSIPKDIIISMYGYGEDNIKKDILYKNHSIYDDQNPNIKEGKLLLNDTDKLRRIGNIFLNVNMLLNIAEKNADNEGYSIGMFIKDIFKEVNKVCPNHNFVLTDDKESNNIFIIDLPVDNSELPTGKDAFHEFIPFSNKNILRNFDYTSNVPSALTATIAVQGQDARNIQDIDGVTFAAFNKSIKNRILSKDTESTWEKTKKDIEAEGSKMKAQQQSLYLALNNYRLTFFRNIRLADNDKDTIGGGNIIGSLKSYQKNASYLSTTQKGKTTFNSVIPLEFSATLDGISGMVIGNIFKVHKDRLPKAYHKSNIGFILFNEEQKITAGGDWTTDISGKMTILPEHKITVKGAITIIPGGVEEVAVVETQLTTITTTDSETVDLDIGQERITNINDAIPGTTLYLKKIKQTYIETIDDDDVDTSITTGYTTVRSKNLKWIAGDKGPLVDNEHDKTLLVGDYDDNAYGMFDSWKDGGMLLGVVKISEDEDIRSDPHYDRDDQGNFTGRWVIRYKDNQRRILAENVSKYIKDVDESDLQQGFLFRFEEISPSDHGIPDDDNTYLRPIPQFPYLKDGDGSSWYWQETYSPYKKHVIEPHIEINNIKYLFHDGLTSPGEPSILKEDTTDIQTTWFSVHFTEEASEKFLGGYVREETNIKTNGADEFNRIEDAGSLANFSSPGGNSKGLDCWMHFSTLAITEESAIGPNTLIINEIPPDDQPSTDEDSNEPITVTYTYRANTDTQGVWVIVENNIGLPSFRKDFSSATYTQDTAIAEVKFTMDNWGELGLGPGYPKANTTYP